MSDRDRALTHLIELAIPQIAELPPQQRADAYDEIAAVAWPHLNHVAARARETADAIRDAEAAQLSFRSIL